VIACPNCQYSDFVRHGIAAIVVFLALVGFAVTAFYFKQERPDKKAFKADPAQRLQTVWIVATVLTGWIVLRLIMDLLSNNQTRYAAMIVTVGPIILMVAFLVAAKPLAAGRQRTHIEIALRHLLSCMAVSVLGAGLLVLFGFAFGFVLLSVTGLMH
jgi:hypothetical protein